MRELTVIHHVEELFSRELILYGEKVWNEAATRILGGIGLTPHVILDIGEDNSKMLLQEKAAGQITIPQLYIITSENLQNQLHADLRNAMVLEENMITIFGMAAAIYLNCEAECIPMEHRLELKLRERMFDAFRKKMSEKYLIENFKTIQNLKPEIFVYQPGKVGSSSIYLNLFHHCKVAATHGICPTSPYLKHLIPDSNQVAAFYEAIRKQTKKIITLVREPISRDLAAYFEGIMVLEQEFLIPKLSRGANPLQNSYEYFMTLKKQVLDSDTPSSWYVNEFAWFDYELKEAFGVDLYKEPFDCEKGYSIVKTDTVEILVIQMERLDEMEEVLREFTGIKEFQLSRVNEAKGKIYQAAYKELKESLVLPKEYVMYYYDHNEKMNHFYSKKQQKEMFKRWESRII